jgi:hypothetical protein
MGTAIAPTTIRAITSNISFYNLFIMSRPANRQRPYREFLIGLLINTSVHLVFWGLAAAYILPEEAKNTTHNPYEGLAGIIFILFEGIPICILLPFLTYLIVKKRWEAMKGLIFSSILTMLLMGGLCFGSLGGGFVGLMSGLVFWLAVCTLTTALWIFLPRRTH